MWIRIVKWRDGDGDGGCGYELLMTIEQSNDTMEDGGGGGGGGGGSGSGRGVTVTVTGRRTVMVRSSHNIAATLPAKEHLLFASYGDSILQPIDLLAGRANSFGGKGKLFWRELCLVQILRRIRT